MGQAAGGCSPVVEVGAGGGGGEAEGDAGGRCSGGAAPGLGHQTCGGLVAAV